MTPTENLDRNITKAKQEYNLVWKIIKDRIRDTADAGECTSYIFDSREGYLAELVKNIERECELIDVKVEGEVKSVGFVKYGGMPEFEPIGWVNTGYSVFLKFSW